MQDALDLTYKSFYEIREPVNYLLLYEKCKKKKKKFKRDTFQMNIDKTVH